ncbi:hypothetical protein [Brevibacterium aurantiacum]|uniref:Uncharacterized protein n=1 Tax=Brevibacterium aurantiacum TaxID=273384 RepID=A0A556CB22_BREAU|nr:hypothetical protein [Brevibacterium aurantiacum]TSI14649.1 hypothetical protein FO013_14975 [Brevibacterium aurantiacum]
MNTVEEAAVSEQELAAAEAELGRASDECDVANARADRAREVLGRLQCRFSWRPENVRPGWPVMWCGRPVGHEGAHDARFYLEENPCEEFANAVGEFAAADRAAEIAGRRWMDSISTVQKLKGEDVIDAFDQYPLDGFWDPRWDSSLRETEDDERE